MSTSIQSRRRRRNPIATKATSASLPLAVRVLMRRFGLMPGMAATIAAAAGFNMEAR